MGDHRGGDKASSIERRNEDLLVARARDGDVDAFSQLVLRYQDVVFGLVARLVRDAEAAKEITQDAFVKAHRSLPGFRGDARFSTWLYRIAVNLCHDHHASARARMRRGEMSLDDPESGTSDIPSTRDRPDDVVGEARVTEAFREALESLDEGYRAAFLLRHQEALGYDEIASILGISHGNAKVRVHRAREMILAALRKRGYEV